MGYKSMARGIGATNSQKEDAGVSNIKDGKALEYTGGGGYDQIRMSTP